MKYALSCIILSLNTAPANGVPAPRVSLVSVQVSAQIMRAETISIQAVHRRDNKGPNHTDRQYRSRKQLPLVEFY